MTEYTCRDSMENLSNPMSSVVNVHQSSPRPRGPPLVPVDSIAECSSQYRLRTMEDQKSDISVHHPPTRMALVLDLIVRPEVPLASDFSAPKGIVVARVCRPDLTGMICSTLCCNPPVLHLNILARWTLSTMTVDVRWPSLSDHVVWGLVGLRVAVGDMVCSGCCSTAGWIDMRRVAIVRHRVVVSPLVRGIEVSKRVHRAIQVVIVVAIAAAVATAIGIRVRIVVGGVVGSSGDGVWLGVVRTSIVYRRLIGTRRVSNTTNTHTDADADACIADSIAISAYDACGCSAVGRLAGIAEKTALTVAGVVDVLVAGLWICLHYDDRSLVVGEAMKKMSGMYRRNYRKRKEAR